MTSFFTVPTRFLGTSAVDMINSEDIFSMEIKSSPISPLVSKTVDANAVTLQIRLHSAAPIMYKTVVNGGNATIEQLVTSTMKKFYDCVSVLHTSETALMLISSEALCVVPYVNIRRHRATHDDPNLNGSFTMASKRIVNFVASREQSDSLYEQWRIRQQALISDDARGKDLKSKKLWQCRVNHLAFC